MGRSDGRPNAHIQEKRPSVAGDAPAAPPARPSAEERLAIQEGRQRAWRWAATLWAIVFLFLAALLVFDLVAGFLRG